MSAEKLTADIKTRVPTGVKLAFEQIAEGRHLDVADIAREAFREYLAKHADEVAKAQQPELLRVIES